MKLDAFRFRHVGPFGAEGVEVSGLRPGLNVIAEHNERGKSSLLAALETVLFLPHTSWKGEAKRLAREDGAPVGEVDFTHEGRAYRLRKRFVKSRRAELLDRASGEVLAVKREAEERLGAMLGFDGGSQGPSGLLWVRQGDSLNRAEDDGQVASRLETELSTLVGGDRARAYLERTEAELGELLTPTGRVRMGGPLAAAEAELDATQAALTAARAAQAATRQTGQALIAVRERLRLHKQQENPQTEAADLAQARKALDSARLARSTLDAKQNRLDRLELERDGAKSKLEAHLQSVQSLDATQAKIEELQAAYEQTLAARDTAKNAVDELAGQLDGLEESREALNRLDRIRANQDRLSARNAALQSVQDNLDALEAETRKRVDLVAERAALPSVSREVLDRIGTLDRAIDRAEARLSGLDATLIVDFKPGVDARIGAASIANGPVRLDVTQTLTLGGVGTIRLDAPEARTERAGRDGAIEERDTLYARMGVDTPEAAQQALRDREALSADIALLDKLIAQIAPDGRDALEDARTRLSEEVSQLSSLVEDVPELDETLEIEALDSERARVRGELAATQDRWAELSRSLARMEAELGALRRDAGAAPETARPAMRDATRASLSGDSATLQSRVEDARSELDALRSAPSDDPALLEARIQRLEDLARNRAETLSELRMEEAKLDASRRQSFEQRDPDAEVTRLEERAERQRETVERHRRRAQALTLLRDTLRGSQRTLQDRYTEPVRRELLPLLRQVIDGADVALDEKLGANGLVRAGGDDALERLSGGTREQIAVLTRLAFARLLARGGQPCPVILDDALVYADDARRGRMFDVLNYVAGGDDPLQLLYLSCHEASTFQLGGHRLRLTGWPED